MMFEDQGVTYKDVRISREEWPGLKKTLVETGQTPFGQLPIVELAGQIMPQSAAFNRYFAKIFGKTPPPPPPLTMINLLLLLFGLRPPAQVSMAPALARST